MLKRTFILFIVLVAVFLFIPRSVRAVCFDAAAEGRRCENNICVSFPVNCVVCCDNMGWTNSCSSYGTFGCNGWWDCTSGGAGGGGGGGRTCNGQPDPGNCCIL